MTPLRLLALVAASLASAGAVAALPAASDLMFGSEVRRAGTMTTTRAVHQAALLIDGRVLITGGCPGHGCSSTLASAELFDPATGRFSPIGNMTEPRSTHLTILLPDSRILLAGGWTGRHVTGSAEVFDPTTGRFAAAGQMTAPRMGAMAAPLGRGRTLIAGGQDRPRSLVASAEIYDAATGRFTSTGPMTEPRSAAAAVTLPNGQVLVTGGNRSRGEVLQTAELYEPATGRFRPTGRMMVPRHKHAAVLLADGRVLIIGGSDQRDGQGRYTTTEFYDPATERFTAGPRMHAARYKIVDAVVALPDGTVLVAGDGERPEIYDPGTGAFRRMTGTAIGALAFSTATRLMDGRVLVVGGYDEQIRSTDGAWTAALSP